MASVSGEEGTAERWKMKGPQGGLCADSARSLSRVAFLP